MGTWPTCIKTFFPSLGASEQASVQDQDSTTGRITLIITPKSDSNAHLINISLIIGLIILLEAWESWEEWWHARDRWLPHHVSCGFKEKSLQSSTGQDSGLELCLKWIILFYTRRPKIAESPERFEGEEGRKEERKKQREGFLRPHQSFRFCPSDAFDGASKRCHATASGSRFNTDLFTRHLRLI